MDRGGDGSPGPVHDLQLLGRWRLRSAGADVAVPAAGQRLVALLALRGPGGRGDVAATLWPNHPPGEARAMLRRTLWATARVLPGLVLVLGPVPLLSLWPGLAVDTDRLQALAASVLAGRTLADDAGRPLLDAPGLLEGWDDDWVREERERLSTLRLGALDTLAEHLVAAGAGARALTVAEEAMRLDPLCERSVTVAIRAHLAMGNPALAVRCYQDLVDRFRRELDVEPALGLLELVRPYAPALR